MGVKVTIEHDEAMGVGREDRFINEEINYGQAYVDALCAISEEMDLDSLSKREQIEYRRMEAWLHSTRTLEQRLHAVAFGPWEVRVEMYPRGSQ